MLESGAWYLLQAPQQLLKPCTLLECVDMLRAADTSGNQQGVHACTARLAYYQLQLRTCTHLAGLQALQAIIIALPAHLQRSIFARLWREASLDHLLCTLPLFLKAPLLQLALVDTGGGKELQLAVPDTAQRCQAAQQRREDDCRAACASVFTPTSRLRGGSCAAVSWCCMAWTSAQAATPGACRALQC